MIRLLGWRPDGSALVVAYQPDPAVPTRFDQPLPLDQRTAYGNVHSIRLLSLRPGTREPVTVLTAPAQVLAIDVADDVAASGRVRRADPPHGVGPRVWYWIGPAVVAVAGVLFGRWALSRRRSTSGRRPGGGSARRTPRAPSPAPRR